MSRIKQETWEKFSELKLLWWINRILQTFGWVIVLERDDDGKVLHAYPARTSYRGFAEDIDERGFEGFADLLRDPLMDSSGAFPPRDPFPRPEPTVPSSTTGDLYGDYTLCYRVSDFGSRIADIIDTDGKTIAEGIDEVQAEVLINDFNDRLASAKRQKDALFPM